MNLKALISDEILTLNNNNISIVSMKIFYLISEKLLEINTNEKFKHSDDKIYNVSAICTDNIECLLNSVIKDKDNLLIESDELTDIVYKFVITNLKYL